MKKILLLAILGIITFAIGMYFIIQYQTGIVIPAEIDNNRDEFFYRIGYMQKNGNRYLLLFTIVVPSILLAIASFFSTADINKEDK
jgi:hypothetical protein